MRKGAEKSRTCRHIFGLYLDGYGTFGVHIRVLLFGEFKLSYSFVLIRLRDPSFVLVTNALEEGP